MTEDVLNSPALSILLRLESDGLRVSLRDDDTITASPRSRLSADQCNQLYHYRDHLRSLLKICDSGVQERLGEFKKQLAARRDATLPSLLFRPGQPYVKGLCFSCGEHLAEVRYGRCWRCSYAWRLAAGIAINPTTAQALDEARVA